MTRPALRHRLEYLALAGAAAAARVLGERPAGRLGEWLGRIGYRPIGIRRSIVEAHLRHAFPDRSDAWVRATAAAAYAHLGREAMALLRLASVDRQELVRRTRVSGLHQLREALAAGRGVVLVTAHLGNWELGGALLAAHGVRLAAVAQRQGNPLVDTVLNRARERLGVQVIERGRASSRALEALRAGCVVAFLPDQDARRAGVFVPFLGRPASTHRGPALLALRAGAPLFVGVVLRSGAGYEARVEEVEASREGSVEDVVYRLTAAFTRKLELAVRSAPDQYFWHHRRWKTRPPAEPVAARQV